MRGGECQAIRVLRDGVEFRAGWNGEGSVTEFPYLFKGELAQVQVEYAGDSRIARLSLVPAAGETVEEADGGSGAEAGEADEAGPILLEVLEYDGNSPSLLRARQGDLYSFILLQRGTGFMYETWYDEAGAALAAYEHRRTGRINEVRRRSDSGETVGLRHYDSRFLLTAMSGPGGGCSVNYYRQNLPKYWERQPAGHYSLQWDEGGFLVRCYGASETTAPGAAENGGGEDFFDCRYEYTLDDRGNWVERREFLMTRRFGLLSAMPGETVRREILYREAEWPNP